MTGLDAAPLSAGITRGALLPGDAGAASRRTAAALHSCSLRLVTSSSQAACAFKQTAYNCCGGHASTCCAASQHATAASERSTNVSNSGGLRAADCWHSCGTKHITQGYVVSCAHCVLLALVRHRHGEAGANAIPVHCSQDGPDGCVFSAALSPYFAPHLAMDRNDRRHHPHPQPAGVELALYYFGCSVPSVLSCIKVQCRRVDVCGADRPLPVVPAGAAPHSLSAGRLRSSQAGSSCSKGRPIWL